MSGIEPSGDHSQSDERTLKGERSAPPPPRRGPTQRRPDPAPLSSGDGEVTRPVTRPRVRSGSASASRSTGAQPASVPPALRVQGIARYRLGDELGRGGLGVVRVARDTSLQRDVAIKSILRAESERAVLSFVEEAQITGQLEHPNIVPVHEIGLDSGGRPYLSMKRVHGRTLREVIAEAHATRKKRPAEWPAAEQRLIDIFLKVCDAIAYAHSRGVIHRDLKPDNIMVGAFGEVLVMDWGLARPLAAIADGTADDEDAYDPAAFDPATQPVVSDRRADTPHVTRDGAIVGTPAYMAPEQAAGRTRELDERTDIYALGAILYTIAVGKPPLSGADRRHVQQILADVIAGRVPAPRPASGGRVTRELDAIIRKAMAVHADDRYRTAVDLQADLTAWRAFQSTTARRAGLIERAVRWTRRHPTMTLTAGLLLVAGFVVTVLLMQLQASEQAARFAELEKGKAEQREAQQRVEADRLRTRVGREQEMLDLQTQQSIALFERVRKKATAGGLSDEDFGKTLTSPQVAEFIRAYDALFDVHRVLKTDPTVEQYFNRALIRSIAGDFEAAIEDYGEALRINPQLAIAFDNRGLARVGLGDLDGAIRDFDQALSINPDQANTLNNRGSVRRLNGDLEGAIRDFDHALRINQRFVSALNNRGVAHTFKGDLEAAIRDYDEALRLLPGFVGALNNRGIALRVLGNFEAAMRDYDEALRIRPGDAVTFHNRALVRQAMGDLEGAIRDFNEAIRIDPGFSEAMRNRANAHRASGDVDQALRDCEAALRISPEDADGFKERGRVRKEMGDLDGAIRDFDEALRLDPDNADALNNRGHAKQIRGDLNGAIRDFTEAVRIKPEFSGAWYNRGNVRLAIGDPEAAIRDYDEALRINPEDSDALSNRGNARRAIGDLPGAIRDYDEAIRINPESADLFNNRGDARLEMGDLAGAIRDLDEALQLDPDHSAALYNRGNARKLGGDPQGAIRDYDRVLEVNPGDVDAMNNRGSARKALGDLEGALRDYDEALRINPRFWRAAANRGIALIQSGHAEDGIASLQQAYRICSDSNIRQRLAADIQRFGGIVPEDD